MTDFRRHNQDRLLAQENLILEATEAVCEAMERKRIKRSELARRLKLSRAHITQTLSGEKNMTLRTLSDFLYALGLRAKLKIYTPKRTALGQHNLTGLPQYSANKGFVRR